MTQEHSIARHPLRELLTAEEWEQLRDDVQYCRASWPISWIVEPATEPERESADV